MPAFLRRRLWVLLISAAVAAGAWLGIPGTYPDRSAVRGMARGFANPPFFFSGDGSHARPWALRTLSPYTLPADDDPPLVVSLGDDPENFFQSSPPAPIDLAVVLSNIRRLGATKAATAAVLAWEAPDPISLVALENALDGFDAVVTAAPLSRGAVPSAIPPQFRRATISLDAVEGNAASLPIVNRLPIPGVILGGENALAGFTVLDSEEPGGRVPLVARWDDRVVFAFPVLAVLLRHDLPLAGVEVRPGHYLKLGPDGPIVPIDRFGRLSVALKPVPPFKVVPAEMLIDGGAGLFPETAPDPVILRDDQSAAETPTRDFSAHLAATVAAIASEAGLAPPREFRRLPLAWEAGVLAVVVALLAGFCGLPKFQRHIAFGALAGVAIIAQWIALGMAAIWLPALSGLLTIAAAGVASHFIFRKNPAAASAPEPILPPANPEPTEPEPAPPPKPKPAAKKRARETSAENAATTESATNKAAAKKPPPPAAS